MFYGNPRSGTFCLFIEYRWDVVVKVVRIRSLGGSCLTKKFYSLFYIITDLEQDGIWLNVHDRVGTVMSSIVWVLVCKY